MSGFEITGLWIYPVKSLGGMQVDRVDITPGGSFAGDREWLVVDPEGQMLWQGNIPRMTLVRVETAFDALTLRLPDGDTISVPLDHGGTAVPVTQYGFSFAAVDAGDQVAQWLSAFFEQPCRLVRIGEEAHRWGGLNPVHAISLTSLAVLNERMALLGEAPIELERLRPNVVLGGEHRAFAEEQHAALSFGDARIVMVEPCIRCELPNISRVDASRQRQPLKLIGKMAKERPTSRPASFGMYGRAEGTSLAVGAVSYDVLS